MSEKDYGGYVELRLEPPELLAIRNRWTARSANGARSEGEMQEQLAEAQRDLGRLLRHLDAFDGPPIIEE